jgi:hypothetical protein
VVDKGNADKHRYSMSGAKVVEESKWGANKARERYGAPTNQGMTKPEDRSAPQKLGDSANLRGPVNDHRNDWVRGAGESAEGKPGFRNSQGYNGKK